MHIGVEPDFGFSNGLSVMWIFDDHGDYQGGYMDKKGKIVVTPRFAGPEKFSEGLASVSVGGKRGYIDKTGKMVINPAFDIGWDFSEGLARVCSGNKWGYINKSGSYVWSTTD